MAVTVNPQIFREYDVRGLVGQDLTDAAVEELGKGYGTYMRSLGHRRAALGYDMRPSSEPFAQAIGRGMLSTGLDVVKVGCVPTPLLYYSLFHLNVNGGVMITGSHNPPEFNGFKLAVGQATIYGEDIQKIRRIIDQGQYASGHGTLTETNVVPDYTADVEKRIGPFARRLKVVVDAGNGMGGPFGPGILRDLGAEVIELFTDLDGTFPNHHPDPTVPKNMEALVAQVLKEGADLGVAYDGDADRLGVVSDQGKIMWGDQLLILFSREVLTKHPGASIIFEVKCSQTLFDDIAQHGGRPLMWRTGHSLIKEKMKEEKSPLAGEMSGHFFFADEYYGYDDAIYASCRVIRRVAQSGQKISAMLSDVPVVYSTPETRVDCPDEEKFQVVEKLREYFKQRYKVIDVDGVRVVFEDGWGLVRASNTQPVLVVRFEAKTPERLQAIQKLVLDKLAEVSSVNLS